MRLRVEQRAASRGGDGARRACAPGLGDHLQEASWPSGQGAFEPPQPGEPRVARILIGPHLEHRLGFAVHPKMRFPGCHAMRHDGQMHFEVARDAREDKGDTLR